MKGGGRWFEGGGGGGVHSYTWHCLYLEFHMLPLAELSIICPSKCLFSLTSIGGSRVPYFLYLFGEVRGWYW